MSASSSNRADLINKLFKVAKKHYEAIKPPADRAVLENMLYACCLEDSEYEAADEVFARLQSDYLNWNEVRVTTIAELAGVMKKLHEPEVAALRLRRSLHGMFEAHYQFDLDFLKKENLGKAVQTMEKYRGITPFVVSYTAQSGLSGHSIPVDKALLQLLYVVGVISEAELEKRKIPGLSRVIPKAKGVEFSSVVHQLAVAFYRSPFNKNVREIILEVTATAKDRFPKRGAKKKVEEEAPAKPAKKAAAKPTKKTADKPKKADAKATKKATKKTPPKPAKKAPVKKKAVAKKATKKKAPAKATKAKPSKKAAKKAAKKKSPTKRLARKKPR